MWWLAGCVAEGPVDGGPVDGSPVDGSPVDTGAIALAATVSIPTSAAPLVRLLHVEADTDAPITVHASWDSGDHRAEATLSGAGDHLLLGFRPGRTYALTVAASAGERELGEVALEVVTDPAPAHFPRTRVSGQWPVEPGHTLVSMRSGGAPAPAEVAAVYDEEGQLVWYLAVDDVMQDVTEVGGELFVLTGSTEGRASIYGWDGLVRRSFTIGPGGIEAEHARLLHHDAVLLPGPPERIVALGRAVLPVPDYPADYDDPEPTAFRNVSDDVVLDWRTDGVLLREDRLSSLIPVHRIGYDSLGTTVDGGADWAHANAVVPDGEEVLVSLRHQDALVKLDADGQIRWILGHPDNWPEALHPLRLQPTGALSWPYHQHGPWLGPADGAGERALLLFDNGNYQAAPYTGTPPVPPESNRSRVVQFTIDEEARTVREDWSFDAPAGGRLFSEAVGDAERLPGGHVLSTWGFLERLPDGTPNEAAGLGHHSVRLVEIDPATVSQVGELYLYTEAADNESGWTAYRSARIGSLAGRVVE